ncbi:hypothetical protein RIF29_04520 [Crotalaria pallida]|uniref:O-methyltransferase n=1 Tax=Crotalaria pallida TaxID=3830 RepID=A0AAN9J3K6_CROPI
MAFNENRVEESELHNAQIHLYKHAYNYLSSMALRTAMELGIPDAIQNHGKPITLSELASVLKLHPSKIGLLGRFMRLLTHNGFFAKTNQEAYALTPPSKLLTRSDPFSLVPYITLVLLDTKSLQMWQSSMKWFTEDKDVTLFESATGGISFWEYFNGNLGEMKGFQEAMEADSRVLKVALKECKHVFENLESLVDVAGGNGSVTKLIHEAFPHLKCTVFDQPHVVANCSGINTEMLNFVGGDMFNSIPSVDAVLLKWVLHNWNDEQCLKILKNCKKAISGKGKEGKVIIIDIVIDEINDDHKLTGLKLDLDLIMLTLFNGKEREKKEWEKLIFGSGFSNYKITPICGFKSIIEVYP